MHAASPRRVRTTIAAALLASAIVMIAAFPNRAHAISRAPASPGLSLGFVQDQYPPASWWDPEIRSLGGRYVRYELSWAQAEPRWPASRSNPSDPANPAIHWPSYIDQDVRSASAAGLRVILLIDQAPSWAEGRGRPAGAPAGTWRPNGKAFGQFAHAAAVRYSGSYPDPLHPGARLPAVRSWIAWNEPNEPSEINPQWQRVKGRIVPASPDVFRPMVSAFYAQVKKVSRANRVIAGGLAPFGDLPGGPRMQPMTFLRGLLCLNQSLHSACHGVTRFDSIDMHPYSPKDPHWHALSANDVTVPDIYKLNRALAAAQRLHHVAPGGRKSVIVTEFSWDTDPPDPHGIPLMTQARWLQDGLYVLWQQHVRTILWWRLTDQDPGVHGYAYTYQSGVLFENGKPKPSATAFRFPFVVHHLSHGRVVAWGRVPASGTLRIQRLVRHQWKTLRSYRVGGNDVFDVKFSLSGSAVLRAVAGAHTSLNWSLR